MHIFSAKERQPTDHSKVTRGPVYRRREVAIQKKEIRRLPCSFCSR